MGIAERESVCRDIVIPALETKPAERFEPLDEMIGALSGGRAGGAGGALRGARHGGAAGRFEVLDMAERGGGDPAGGGVLSEIDIEILKAAAGRARQRALQAG